MHWRSNNHLRDAGPLLSCQLAIHILILELAETEKHILTGLNFMLPHLQMSTPYTICFGELIHKCD